MENLIAVSAFGCKAINETLFFSIINDKVNRNYSCYQGLKFALKKQTNI